MRITTKSKYGMMMLVEIAAQTDGKALPLKFIANKLNISEKYLEQIIISLIKAEYVKSVRGAGGGYIMGKHPEELSAAMVIQVLEGDDCMYACTGEIGRCPRADSCTILNMWKEINLATTQVVTRITIADLVCEKNERDEELGITEGDAAQRRADKPACNE